MTEAKKSLALPLFLIIGPAAILILSILLYAVISFAAAAVTTAVSPPTGMSDSETPLSISNSAGYEFPDIPITQQIANIILWLVAAASMLAFIPCLVIGIIMLSSRRSPQPNPAIVSSHPLEHQARSWEDLE